MLIIKFIIVNDTIKMDNYKRYDHISKSLILLIDRENLNKDFKWISYETFNKYLKLTINDYDTTNNIENYIKLIELESDFGLLNKHENNNANKSVKDNNNFDNSKKNSITKDIGLLNLGFTCYLNAILQVLYHINLFKDSILRLDVNDEGNNVLNELIILFDDLNVKKDFYYNPISFINNFGDEVINVNEQKDAHEFLLSLIDKIESKLEKTDNANLIKYFFESSITQTIFLNITVCTNKKLIYII